jgi:hypothetical protein
MGWRGTNVFHFDPFPTSVRCARYGTPSLVWTFRRMTAWAPFARSLEILMSDQLPDEPTRRNETRARQGVTGHNVRYVLSMGLGLAILAGVVLYFTVGR